MWNYYIIATAKYNTHRVRERSIRQQSVSLPVSIESSLSQESETIYQGNILETQLCFYMSTCARE